MNHSTKPKEKIIGGGLQVPKKKLVDLDFSHAAYFGGIGSTYLPTQDFDVAQPLAIKDQYDSDLCTAFASAAIEEDTYGELIDPCFFFAKTKKREGRFDTFGADPVLACLTGVNDGFLPEKAAPFNLETNSRDVVANWNNYPSSLDPVAKLNHKKAFFKADGQADIFDSIREAMWLALSIGERRSVFVGAYWQGHWTHQPVGIIPVDNIYNKINPHAFKVYGQKTINGVLYLKAQLSNGTTIGDQGIFYFPREIVNKFMYAYLYRNADPAEVKKDTWSLLQSIFAALYRLQKILSNPVGYFGKLIAKIQK